MASTDAPQPTQAMRLIFEYDGNQIRLVSQQPVNMVVTGADLSQVMYPGYYIDTRDNKGRTLSRVVAHGAFSTSAEVFPEKPGEPITRTEMPQQKGAFTIISPLPKNTDHVTVVQITAKTTDKPLATVPGTSPQAGAPEVKEIASFKITAQPKKEGGNQ